MKHTLSSLTLFLFISFAFAQTQLGSDIDGEAADDYSGGSVSMNSAGDRVAIGAYLNDGTASDAGHVRIYEYSNSSWSQLGSDIDGEAADDRSGYSVSMCSVGDRVAIGAYGSNNGLDSTAGHVRVYEYSNSSWTQLGSDIDGEAAEDRSGWSVSMNSNGDRVAIGAYLNDGTDNWAGHVRVYEYSNSSWPQVGSDIDGEAAGDKSGHSVSMNSAGDRVAIGAPFNEGTGVGAGHVRVYSLTELFIDSRIMPTEFALHQNYPNPFNPITTLRYELPENGLVNITIYDMLGREVKTLVNQTQGAGYKSVIWDATNDYGKPVSAGIYLYQIQAGEYISTKKMVLLK